MLDQAIWETNLQGSLFGFNNWRTFDSKYFARA